jgi:hypothetical protein
MPKENLETKSRKAVIRIDAKVTDISNMLRDLNMKLCYAIRNKKEYTLGGKYKDNGYDRLGRDYD